MDHWNTEKSGNEIVAQWNMEGQNTGIAEQ